MAQKWHESIASKINHYKKNGWVLYWFLSWYERYR